MSEPTLQDVLVATEVFRQDVLLAVSDLRKEMDRRFDEVDERVQTLDRKLDTVHGVVRQVQREGVATHNTMQIMLDAQGAFRTEYLREHPGGGHAA